MAVGRKPNFRLADSCDTAANKYYVKAGAATSIKAGDIVLQNTGGDDHYVVAAGTTVVDSTDAQIVGFAATDSTDTASADGTVMVYDDEDAIFIGAPLNASNLAATVRLTKVTIDSAATGVQTVKENDTTNGCIQIMDYTTDPDTVKFRVLRSEHLFA